MYYPHEPENGYFNPDSVLYDSCFCKDRLHEGCDSIYAKQWYEIIFNNKDPYGFTQFPEDTIIETTWQNLDSNYVDLRNMFQIAENMFGTFILRKRYPEITDSTSLGSRGYLIKFQNYRNIFSVVYYFYYTNLLFDFYYKEELTYIPDLIIDDNELDNIFIKIYPIPCYNSITISFSSDKVFSYDIKIIDNLGYELLLENQSIQQGEQSIKINTDKLSEGIYFLLIDFGKNKIVKKIIKIK